LDLNQNDRAIEDYSKVIEMQPNNTGAYNNRGTAFLNKAEYAKATADFNRALKLDPQNTIFSSNIKRVSEVKAENQRKAEEEQREKQRQAVREQREKYLSQFPSVTVEQLLNDAQSDYQINPVAAKQKWQRNWQGKRVLLSGRISIIETREVFQFSGNLIYYDVYLGSESRKLFDGAIRCIFTDRNVVSQLSKGSKVRILGTLGGEIDTDEYLSSVVFLRLINCSVE